MTAHHWRTIDSWSQSICELCGRREDYFGKVINGAIGNGACFPDMRPVASGEFDVFIKAYPRELSVETHAVPDPKVVAYYDWSLSKKRDFDVCRVALRRYDEYLITTRNQPTKN
jgi:hypothetical protein